MSPDILLQPIEVGSVLLPNRVVMTTVKLGYATFSGEVTRRHRAFYARRAEGGAGLLTTEPLFVQPNGREIPTQLGIHEDILIPGLKGLVGAVHAAGGRIMAHLNHAGRAANPKLVPENQLVSASGVVCPANKVIPRPLATEEIQGVIQAFGVAAKRVMEAGFDAIEIPFSHGYLVHQFLSLKSNRREDEYGGRLENRFRFGREVLEAVRSEVGSKFPIVARMNAIDYVEGGLDTKDALQVAGLLAKNGVDALSVTSGTMCESVPFCLYPSGTPKAHLLPMAKQIRKTTALPVIVAGRIRSPAVARSALSAGQTDLVGLGRPFLADPDWVRKVEAGDEEAVLLCAACHQGCLGELRRGNGTHCLFNPLTGRESEAPTTAATQPRRVMVVGGGPAGLEAARVAAQRGHDVSLHERKDALGGQVSLAARVPHKEGFEDAVRHMELMAKRAGVRFCLSEAVTIEQLLTRQPDAVVLATGSLPLAVAFPGLDHAQWALASEVLEGDIEVDAPTALIIGGGLVGLETAEFLAAKGIEVTIVEMEAELGRNLDPLPRAMLLKRLGEHRVEIQASTKVIRLTPAGVQVRKNGEESLLPAEMVVLALGAKSDRELAKGLAASGLRYFVVGDAVEPRGIGEAIWEAHQAALDV
jgi:2,4-dienoyl-CoA reductase-like NADH-dependent reductase (Old Yellow Enzyme family)/thioredoxin reductase